jgi:hypothetical protein
MPSPSPGRLIPTREVCVRYGQKAGRTIRRWVLAGIFPAPDRVINHRNYWYETTLIEHERRAIAEKHAQRAVAETVTTAAAS